MILTPATIKELKKPGRHRLGNGVFLLVSKGSSKSWVLRVTINGKRTDKGLGGWPKVSATEAMPKPESTEGGRRVSVLQAARRCSCASGIMV